MSRSRGRARSDAGSATSNAPLLIIAANPRLGYNNPMTKSFSHAQSRLKSPIEFDALLNTLGAKDRLRIEKQIADYEAGTPALAALWKRLMCSLGTLAPHRTKFNSQTIQYYEQDGKNRRQVFALEDSGKPAPKDP